MSPLNQLLAQHCIEGQGFSQNYNPSYQAGGLLGHTGVDVSCGYGTPIAAIADGTVYSTYPINQPAMDGYTAVFTICKTPLEYFEFSYGHVSEIDVQIGQDVHKGDLIAKEGNHGVVYAGNVLITPAMQKAGDQRGSHRHYQKRPVIRTMQLRGMGLQTAQGMYRDQVGRYYQVYSPLNGFNGCVDWTKPLFPRDLFFGCSGYDVYLLQNALRYEGYATFDSTGYFGLKTMTALMSMQRAKGIPGTGYCGPMIRQYLNANYSQV